MSANMYLNITQRILHTLRNGKVVVQPSSRSLFTQNKKLNILFINDHHQSPIISISASSLFNQHRFINTTNKKTNAVGTSTTNSSTSAIEYKLTHPRKRPLPKIEPPIPSTAEEAVTNILYNTPSPSPSPSKRHILNCLVQNEPGVLSRISGILAGRGFNIDSLVVAGTEISDLSRMTVVLRGQDVVVEQARRQLQDLVPVWAVLNYTDTTVVEREMLLVKVSILGPEYYREQLASIKHMEYDDEFMPEADLEEHPDVTSVLNATSNDVPQLSPSSVLQHKHEHLRSLTDLAKLFGAKVVDVSNDNVIIELTAKPVRIDAFIKLIRPFGVLEAARSGMMALPRTPLFDNVVEKVEEDEDSGVDATALPPG